MPLLQLPPEILAHIFDELGSSFFHADLGRLTICRTWFEFALPLLFKSVTLIPLTLRNLLSSGVMEEPLFQRSLETLELEFAGFKSTPPLPLLFDGHFPWKDNISSDLAKLATRAHQSRRLRTLRIRHWSYGVPEIPFNYYLSLPVLLDLLSLGNLSVLVLDLNGGPYGPRREEEQQLHICTVIGALLSTLRVLHVRMHLICPDALKAPGSNGSLHLHTAVVNMSLNFSPSGFIFNSHSKRCPSGEGNLLQLKTDMQEQAEVLASRMSSPRIVRILTRDNPACEMLSLDILTGKTMVLRYDAPWDAGGEFVEKD
ncbi:hypothetical protein RRF57_012482 [Xylaria bambusicola]|uniref:F-box domain-containing protein n=1 Tax=Xylaria bambusicola TaxID=326684 RepID=A0AAN7Z4J8_9PEZI